MVVDFYYDYYGSIFVSLIVLTVKLSVAAREDCVRIGKTGKKQRL
jgi:hypothetical protein